MFEGAVRIEGHVEGEISAQDTLIVGESAGALDMGQRGRTTRTVHRLPAVVRARVIPKRGERGGGVERVGWLDPYTAETIAADARRAGPGARLEVTVPKRTPAAGIAAVESLFAWLRDKGIAVLIRRGDDDA